MFLLPFCKDCAIIYGFISFSKKFLHMVSNSTGILKKTTAKPAGLITTARYSAVVGAHTSRPRFLAVMHPPRNCINPEKHSQISTGMRRNELLHVFRRAKDGGKKRQLGYQHCFYLFRMKQKLQDSHTKAWALLPVTSFISTAPILNPSLLLHLQEELLLSQELSPRPCSS